MQFGKTYTREFFKDFKLHSSFGLVQFRSSLKNSLVHVFFQIALETILQHYPYKLYNSIFYLNYTTLFNTLTARLKSQPKFLHVRKFLRKDVVRERGILIVQIIKMILCNAGAISIVHDKNLHDHTDSSRCSALNSLKLQY